VALLADDWLRVVGREYLARFVPGGGSAVKVVVGNDADLETVDTGLQGLARASQLTTMRVDAAATRIHMIQNVFFAVAQGIDWSGLAQRWIEIQFRANGYQWPRPGEPVPLRDLAEHNNVAENLLLRAVHDWLTRGISREHEMAQDFRNAMVHLCLARLEPPDPLSSPPVLDWLNGTLRTIGALRDVPIGAKITRNNGRAMLRSLCHWLGLVASTGIVVRLDIRHLSSPSVGPAGEARYTPSAVLDAFEVLRQFIDDSHLFKGFLLVVLAADALVDGEPRRSILAYSALRQRLESDVRSLAHDNPLAPLVRLGKTESGVALAGGDMTYSGERVTIEALRAGVPPNGEATRRLGTDEHVVENAFLEALKRVRETGTGDGVVAGRLVAGEFGAGKSHLLGYLAEQALMHDFVVSKVTISKETPLFNPERVFAAAIRNAAVQEVNDDIMRVVIERLLDRTAELQKLEAAISLPESGFAPIFAALLHILPKNVVNAEDRAAIARFLSGARLGTPRVRTWLRGAGSIKLFDLGHVRAADLAQQRIVLAPLLFQAAGFSGWCLMFDELELIARYSTLQRGKSYAELARWLALDPKVAIRGTVAIGAMTSDFKDEVFGRRLDQERIPPLLEARDLNDAARLADVAMSIIERGMQELMRPDATRLSRSLEDTRWLYQQSYGWKPPTSSIGEQRAGKPIREYVKSWITGWDIERLYGTRDKIDVQPILNDYSENPDLEKPSGPADDEDEA
jgi:hypothetical protein